MIEIKLYGHLSKYGNSFTMDVDTPRMALSGILRQVKGLRQAMRHGYYGMVKGDLMTGSEIGVNDVEIKFGKSRVFHIVPVVNGRGGGKGFLKIALGVVLLGVGLAGGFAAGAFLGTAGTAFSIGSTAVTWGAIAGLGGAMLLGGVSMMLAPRLDVGNYSDREEKRQSFLFTGAYNATEQGGPIPLLYGQHMCGSVVISGGVSVRDI